MFDNGTTLNLVSKEFIVREKETNLCERELILTLYNRNSISQKKLQSSFKKTQA